MLLLNGELEVDFAWDSGCYSHLHTMSVSTYEPSTTATHPFDQSVAYCKLQFVRLG